MKVELRDTPKSSIAPSINKTPLRNDNNVAFKGKFSSADIATKIDSYMPITVKTAKKLSNGLGEISGVSFFNTPYIYKVYILFIFA